MSYCFQEGQLGIKNSSGFRSIKSILGEYTKPTYIYDKDEMVRRIKALLGSFKQNVSLHYAMKCNHNIEVLKLICAQGVGVDTVSGGELNLAIEAGFAPHKIVLSGVAKTEKEIKMAIELGIKQINVESPQELQRIGLIAEKLQKKVNVAFRMNPDVDPDTHPYIKTGFRENKFGMDNSFIPDLEKILKQYPKYLNLVGLTIHIGSQIRQVEEFKEAIEKTRSVWDHFIKKGFDLKTIDIGGGLGLSYESIDSNEDYALIEEYGAAMSEALKPFKAEVLIEPGRIIAARAGVLITQVQYIKKSPYKNFVIVDTGMHHLLRPSLYRAFHRIEPIEKNQDLKVVLYDIVGPICESSDVLGHERAMNEIFQGDLLAILDTGAYGFTMSSYYNCHEFPNEILV